MVAADCRWVLTAKENGGASQQDTPGFAAPPTGPNKVGKLASANTRHRRQDSASRRRCRPPLKAQMRRASTDGKSRNDAIAGVKLTSARDVVDGLRLVDRLTDPNSDEAIPTALIADDKGPFGFERVIAPPQPRHTRAETRTTDPEPHPESSPSRD